MQTPTVDQRSAGFVRPDGKQTPTGEYSGGTGGNAPGREDGSSRVLWGTNISTDDMQQKIKNFIMHFAQEEEEDEEEGEDAYTRMPYYVDKIKSLTRAGLSFLEIDCQHILQFDRDLYKQLEMYPTEVLQMIDMVCSLIAKENAR